MKKILLSLLLAAPCLLMGQARKALQLPPQQRSLKHLAQPALTPVQGPAAAFESDQSAPVSVPPSSGFFAELLAGVTVYDLQSNGGMARRLHNWGNGEVSATWAMSRTGSEAAGYADRGTGYNQTSGGAFGAIPTQRIEGATRTGFPSFFVTGDGEEWVSSHAGAAGNFIIHLSHKAASATTWTHLQVPTTTPHGGLWTRSCAGGPDGNTIHLIYYTTPTGTTFGGEPVDGIDGTLKYCRSTNGGLSWDILDASLPGITSDLWNALPSEGYQIAANGNNVAIGLFPQTNDCLLFKSTDNGATWAPARVVNEFPLSKWSYDDGYTFDDISALYDSTYYPDSLAMLTTDETGTVMVDDNGMAHVWFSPLFISDPDTTGDNMFTWYPLYDLGIIYWNESMADNSGVVSAYSPDLNDDGSWGDPANPLSLTTHYTAGYGDAFSTGPTVGMDAEGRLYVTFISDHEIFWDNTEGFYHRHPFVARTAPGDFTAWQEAQPILNDFTYSDPVLLPFYEHYFASMATNVDDHVHVLVQQDGRFGITFRETGNQSPEDNNMLYVAFPLDLFPLSTSQPAVKNIALSVAPNPVSQMAQVQFDAEESGTAVLEVFDLLGNRVHSQNLTHGSGAQSVLIPVQGWPAGAYWLRVTDGKGYGSAKLLKL